MDQQRSILEDVFLGQEVQVVLKTKTQFPTDVGNLTTPIVVEGLFTAMDGNGYLIDCGDGRLEFIDARSVAKMSIMLVDGEVEDAMNDPSKPGKGSMS